MDSYGYVGYVVHELVMWLYVVITGHNRFVDLYVCDVGLGLDPMGPRTNGS